MPFLYWATAAESFHLSISTTHSSSLDLVFVEWSYVREVSYDGLYTHEVLKLVVENRQPVSRIATPDFAMIWISNMHSPIYMTCLSKCTHWSRSRSHASSLAHFGASCNIEKKPHEVRLRMSKIDDIRPCQRLLAHRPLLWSYDEMSDRARQKRKLWIISKGFDL